MITCRSTCNMNCSSLITLPFLFLFTLSTVHGSPARGRKATGNFRDSAVESLQPLLTRNKRDSDSSDSSEENHHYVHTRRYYHYEEPKENQFLVALIHQLLTPMGRARRPTTKARPRTSTKPQLGSTTEASPPIDPDPYYEDTDSLLDFLKPYLFDQPDDPGAIFPEEPRIKVPPAPTSRPKKRVQKP